MSTRSKHLQNHFLLERLAIKYGDNDGQELLDIARELLSLILVLYTNLDRFLGRHHNFEWLVSPPLPVLFHTDLTSSPCIPLTGNLTDRLLRGPRLLHPLLRAPQTMGNSQLIETTPPPL